MGAPQADGSVSLHSSKARSSPQKKKLEEPTQVEYEVTGSCCRSWILWSMMLLGPQRLGDLLTSQVQKIRTFGVLGEGGSTPAAHTGQTVPLVPALLMTHNPNKKENFHLEMKEQLQK